MPTNDENLKKLGETLKKLADKEKAKKASKQTPVTISQLVQMGDQLLEDKTDRELVKKKDELSKKPSNPYLTARIKILMNYPEWRRKEIERLEKEGDLENRHYKTFVQEVMADGDRRSA